MNPYHGDLLSFLQYIESFGSFWFDVQRIDWRSAKWEWIPESEEELNLLKVQSMEVERKYRNQPSHMEPALLLRIMGAREFKQKFTIPLAFYREGKIEFDSFRYVNAFMNFYLFLEGLYGGGKTNNKHVLVEFLKSDVVRDAVDYAIQSFKEPGCKTKLDAVMEMLGPERQFDVRGVLDLLVRTRGDLFHYSIRSTRPKGHPLNHQQFEPIAYLAFGITADVVAHIMSSK